MIFSPGCHRRVAVHPPGRSLGVTERAARRCVAILREASIPVESTRGRYGGYRLGRGVKLPPVIFTEVQALSLVMAVLEAGPVSGDRENVLAVAMDKVISVLPETVRAEAALVWQHASGAVDRSSQRPDPATTATLVAASAARQQTANTYTSESGASWEEQVDPWAVVTRHGYWYLLCHSHRAAATRAYRIDRIGAVTRTARTFEPPEHLDAVAELEEHLGRSWEFPTTVSFDAPFDEVAPWIRPPMGRLEHCGTGCRLVGITSNPTMYASEWLARLPFRFCVEGGSELREAVTQLADRLTAAAAP